MPKKPGAAYSCELITEYATQDNEEVQQEIEVIQSTFDGVTVFSKNPSRRKLNIPITCESNPARKVFLEITLIPGYPYVAPLVRLILPGGAVPGDKNTLSAHEIDQMRKEVSENIQPCLSSGMPCLLQIASSVSSIVDNGCSAPPTPKVDDGASADKLSKRPSPGTSPSPGQSPALTPVPLKAKDALRLSLLTLHVLRKCCHMKSQESKEEANSNFEWLANYLMNKVNVFPVAAKAALPWRGEPFARAFSQELQQQIRQEQQPVHPAADVERHDLTKWLWESEELPLKLQQGTEGRYQTEFIQQRLLGSGGFAPVYVCRKKIDGRLYAIKKVVMGEGQSEKIIREVQTLAALNHQNIVRYYDAWVEDGCEEELRQYLEDEEDEEESEESEEVGDKGKVAKNTKPPRTNVFDVDTDSEEEEGDSSETLSKASDDAHALDSSDSESSDEEDEEDEDEDEDDYVPQWKTQSPTKEHKCAPTSSGRVHQTLYIQMELCSARSLRHLIEEGDVPGAAGTLTSENGEKVAASILRQLLSVIAHTHRENIVHRDLKPDNVLFEMKKDYVDGEIGTIRVADFGLARVMSGAKHEAGISNKNVLAVPTGPADGAIPTGNLGSVLYCAPEQEKGSDYGFKVDEFSIGMIALEMWLVIAGKGFRDRFDIMSEIWRTGVLPEWFRQWNPSVSQVIGSLLELDVQKRRSCEEVLATANLPGDPVDILEALDTIERYGDRVAARVIQKVQKLGNQYRKPPPTLRDSARLLASGACTDFAQTVMLVGMLHGSAPVVLFDSLIPVNPALSEVVTESVVDSAGRCFCYAPWPQFALASFLGMQDIQAIGSFHTFYHKVRSYAAFITPLQRSDAFNESVLEPVLSLLHLLSYVDVTSSVELVISHADWLNTVFPKEVGNRLPPTKLLKLRAVMDSSEKVSSAVSVVSAAMAEEGLAGVDERDELIRKYASAIVDIVAFFGRSVAAHVSVVLDPALEPSEDLVSRACLGKGIIFECRAAAHGVPLPIAFGCLLDNFASRCTVVNAEISSFCVTIDVAHFVACWKHFRSPGKEGLLLDGVAVKRHDQYALAQMLSVVEAAVELWNGNIRACLRTESDTHVLARVIKAKHLRWILVDGKRIVSASTLQQNKMFSKQADTPISQLRDAIRNLALEERAGAVQKITETSVVFVPDREDKRTAEEAREVFSAMDGQLKGPIVVVPLDVSEVNRFLKDLNETTEPQGSAAPLLQWVRANIATIGILPIFAEKDAKMLLFVNQKKFRAHKRKDSGTNNKKKK